MIGASRAQADDGVAAFWVPDPEHRLAGVRLHPDVPVGDGQLDFRPSGDGWRLTVGRPPVSRMEYLVELRYPGGGSTTVTDPGNPRQVPGAFGPKSVIEFPSYTPPGWLTGPAEPGRTRTLDVAVPALGAAVSVITWSPAGVEDEEPLPLVVVHDGPEYDTLASLTRYLSAGVTGGWLPRLRAALLAPGPRDRWYSANSRYARALRFAVTPALTGTLATTVRVGMGASLGALAMLHAYCRHPDAFDALFLQSGSFFSPRFDARERRFPYYQRIAAFVAGVHDGALPDRPVPVTLTCGVIEENAQNNRGMLEALRAGGYPAELHEVLDGHNYTAWRDALDPHLTRLLRQVGR
ncbi:MAG TPA: alpha/beta hydrolase-fold protein [Streptosporangiaceae bacterium]